MANYNSQYTGQQIDAAIGAVIGGQIGGLTDEAKAALLACLEKVAWIDDQGQTYYDALYDALYPPTNLSSISCVYTQGGTVYDTDTLDSLKSDLVVTAHYSDYSTQTVTTYSLIGELVTGTSTITVSYGGKTTTFDVIVTQLLPTGYTKLSYVSANGSQYVNTGINETETIHAEYEVAITAEPKVNGLHILSSSHTYFPFLKGAGASECGFMLKGYDETQGGATSVLNFNWEFNRRYVISGFPDIYIDGVYKDRLEPGSTEDSTKMLYLFTYGGTLTNTNYRFYGNLYWCKIYGSNDELLRDFVPAKNSSNIAGLYDLVSETFFTSATNTALIAGEVG